MATPADNNDLADIRARIDELDSVIAKSLQERARQAIRIGNVKADSKVFRPEREAQVLAKARQVTGPLPPEAMEAVYREIIGGCRNLQRPLRVSYLGPAGTYSEVAARQQFGATSTYLPAANLNEVLRQAETGEADVAVLPLENSTEGPVTQTLDLLRTTRLTAIAEILLPIHHMLLSKLKSVDDIKTVAAHPQALAQCRSWLAKYLPAAVQQTAPSNAAAASQVAAGTVDAALAGQLAADQYHLPVLAINIEDEPDNTTRFLALAPTSMPPSGSDKTLLICSLANQAGALYKMLEVFAKAGINLTKLESRPAPGKKWEYLFYLEVIGHQADPVFAKALASLRATVNDCKVVGSYPTEPV